LQTTLAASTTAYERKELKFKKCRRLNYREIIAKKGFLRLFALKALQTSVFDCLHTQQIGNRCFFNEQN